MSKSHSSHLLNARSQFCVDGHVDWPVEVAKGGSEQWDERTIGREPMCHEDSMVGSNRRDGKSYRRAGVVVREPPTE